MKVLLAAFLSLLSCLAFVPSAASAAEPEKSSEPSAPETGSSYARLGAYVAVSGGMALGDIDASSTGTPWYVTVIDKDVVSGSIGLRGGYRFLPHLSAEVLVEYQTGWEINVIGEPADIRAWNVLANMKLHLTETQWQPYFIAGIGIGGRDFDTDAIRFDPENNMVDTLRSHDEAFIVRVGGGIDFYLTDSFTLGGEVVGVVGSGELSELDYAVTSLVLAYHFS